jgi:hypothetical protein
MHTIIEWCRFLSFIKKQEDDFAFTCYTGDGAVLLAFNLDESKIEKLAGFALKCKAPHTPIYKTDEYWVQNKLNFEKVLTSKEKNKNKWGSNEAPFQMFHWIHFPNAGPGKYTYTAYPVYFEDQGVKLANGIPIEVDLNYKICPDFELGFTRGYISSQAYSDRWGKNPAIVPKQKSMDFSTDEFLEKYVWLGAHARKILFDILSEAKDDNSISLDVFAYDFNEPDVIRDLCALGPRVRVFLDDSASHIKESALEPKTKDALLAHGVIVKTGKFSRFAHDKVIIQKKDGVSRKVLTGSANFSIRGFYVQANSVLLFDDAEISQLYETAFEQTFNDMKGFKKSEISSRWFGANIDNGAPLSVSFAPHKTAFSLDRVAEAMESAGSSLMFAMMQVGGTGPVMDNLKKITDKESLYSMGTIEQRGQLSMFKPGREGKPAVASFAYLKKNIPSNFRKEASGGAGQVIHHKFVVCDFNDVAPIVFCGSSNFSLGGEKSNGDNLIAIQDRQAAVCYAIEAIRIYDHYKFRSNQEEEANATNAPLRLSDNDGWVNRYFNSKDIKYKERDLFCKLEK